MSVAGLHPFYKKTLPPVARCHPLRKTLGLSVVLCVVLCVVCVWNDPSRVPTAAVKSRVTTYMYRRATHYMSTRHVTEGCKPTAAVISANMLELQLQTNCRVTERERKGDRDRYSTVALLSITRF